MPIHGLDNCPMCNYALVGLPPPHNCPECGFAYDQHSRAWRPAKPRSLYWQYIGFVIAIIVMAGVLIPDLLKGGQGIGIAAGLVLVALTAVAMLWYFLRARAVIRAGLCIVLSPDGLFTRDETGEDKITWEEFRDIKLTPMGHYIRRTNSTRTTPLPGVFTDTEDLQVFLAAVQLARARAAGHETPTLEEWLERRQANVDK